MTSLMLWKIIDSSADAMVTGQNILDYESAV
jgi:hypothetical protein